MSLELEVTGNDGEFSVKWWGRRFSGEGDFFEVEIKADADGGWGLFEDSHGVEFSICALGFVRDNGSP
jgi:hypothetical protein